MVLTELRGSFNHSKKNDDTGGGEGRGEEVEERRRKRRGGGGEREGLGLWWRDDAIKED